MKVFKVIVAVIFSLPILYMPIEYIMGSFLKADAAEEIKIKQGLFGEEVWMTSPWKSLESQSINDLFTYEQANSIKPEGWEIPTYEEAVEWLEEIGFNNSPGSIDSDYYKVEWDYNGYEDPLLGEVGRGKKHLFWVQDEGEYNYISINKDELTYHPGRTLESSKLSMRLLK